VDNKSGNRLLCDVMPENGKLPPRPFALCPNGVVGGEGMSSARRQRSVSTSPRLRRGSSSSWSPPQYHQLLSPGYEQYQKSLLEVPWPADYGEASSDDLSSEWDSDAADVPPASPSKVVHMYKLMFLCYKRDISLTTPYFCGFVNISYSLVMFSFHLLTNQGKLYGMSVVYFTTILKYVASNDRVISE
jgi:hypothetical protein